VGERRDQLAGRQQGGAARQQALAAEQVAEHAEGQLEHRDRKQQDDGNPGDLGSRHVEVLL
jgi:hypothetical protein